MPSRAPTDGFLVGPRSVALACGLAVGLLGLVILGAWASGSEAVKQVPVKANTALGFVASGAALALCATGRTRAALVPAGLAFAIGALTLAEHLSGVGLGIDELLFEDPTAPAGTDPGRPPLLTAADFALVGLALMSWRHRTGAFTIALVAAALVALLNLAFYLLGAEPPIAETRMAVHSSVGFLALSAGTIVGRGGRLAHLFLGRSEASRLARRLLVPVVFLPLIFGLLARRSVDSGTLTVEQALAFALFGNLSVLLVLVGLALLGVQSAGQRRDAALAAERRAVADLRVASAERKAFFERNLDMMAILGFDGRFKDLNPAWATTLGHPLDAMLGRPYIDFVHPDDVERTQREAGRLSASGQPLPFENRYRRADGSYAWLRWTTTVSQDLQVFLATAKDVTAERAAQQAVREAEARFRALFEKNPIALALSRADGFGLVDVNSAFERLLGYGRDEALGAGFDASALWADPGLRPGLMAAMRSAGGTHGTELALRRKDGAIRHAVLSSSTVEVGGQSCFLVGLQDVTDAKEAEEAASRARERFQRIFEASPVATLLSHPEGRIENANPAFVRLMGYPREEVTAAGFTARQLYEDPEERGRLLLSLRTGGSVRDREVRLLHRDGHAIDVLIAMELIDLGGNTTVLSLFQDISALKAAQREREARISSEAELERLRRTDQFRAQFINSTAHELGTPMTPLVLSLGLLRRQLQDRPDALPQVATMERATERLRRVIGDMVSAADLQARAIALDRRRLDLARQLAAAVAGHQEAAHRANVELLHAGDGGITVMADEQRLQLALGHLLGNALKFTPAGGRVTLSAEPHDDQAKVSVTDTGIGLTRREMQQLFKPYAQAHDKAQRTDSGSGLGLYVTRGIVELHGGEVGVHSAGPGLGSTFWFTLPLAPGNVDPLSKAAKAAREAAEAPAPEPRRNLNPGVDGDAAAH